LTDEEILALAMGVIQRRAGTPAPSLTVRELYNKYAAAQSRRKSWRTYDPRLRPFVERFGERDAMAIRVIDWSDHRTAREAEELSRGNHYKASTLNLELGCVKAMFNWAAGEGRIPHNPITGARRVKTRRHRQTAPTEVEIGALLDEAGPAQRVVILCAVDSGMRCSEIRALMWSWIDRDTMTIALPDWACKGERGGIVMATQRELDAIDAMPRHLRSPYVLTSPRGEGMYNRRSLSRWWRAAADAAGLQAAPGDRRVVLHDGRHAFATNAVERNVGIEAVSDMLRHSSLEQTRSYVQRRPRDMQRAREAFEAGIQRDKLR
jgi:integrase